MIKKLFSFKFFTWLAIIGLAAGLGYQLFYNDKSESSEIHAISEANTKQQQALQTITQILSTHDNQFKQVAEHSNQVVASIKELDAYVHSDNNAWRLMQVQNFLGLAMAEATLLNDLPAAMNLLVAADSMLKTIDNPNLLPVRKALQEDLAALSQNPASHLNDILLALNQISVNVPNFPHKIKLNKNSPNEAQTPNPDEPKWEQRAQTAWQELKSLIRIQHHDQPIVPYFSQDEVTLINETLSLILEQASFAAARHYPDLYKSEIKHAQDWMKQYYDVSDPNVQQALKNLAQLETIPVSNNLTLHLKTLDAWATFVNTKKAGSK